MKKSILFILSLCFTGCSYIAPTITNQIAELDVDIASDIPASEQPCVDISNSDVPELSIRRKILAEVAAAFSSEDFEKLETYYNIYKQRTSRTNTGLWKLGFFYDGISGTYDSSAKEKDENNWNNVESKINKWVNLYPKSPAPYIVYSRFLIDRGWHFRGSGYAREIAPEGWKLLDKNIELARNTLENSKAISSVDPEWYANILEIAMLQSWSKQKVNNLVSEALSKEAYYQRTYDATFRYLLPKWSGSSFAEGEKFASNAARITNKCDGQGMYARIYWYAITIESDFRKKDGHFDFTKMKWEKIRVGFDDLIQHYPNPWIINNYAKFACLAQDTTKTKELMDKIDNKPLKEAWGDIGYDFSYCQALASQP